MIVQPVAFAVFTVLATAGLIGCAAQMHREPRCAALAQFADGNVHIDQARELEAAARVCRVTGSVRSTIGFQIDLPIDWNGKLLFRGGGGFDGFILPEEALTGGFNAGDTLARFAIVRTDGGHRATPDTALSAAWALGRPDLVDDYAYRAVHETHIAAQAIIERHYGRPASRHYFDGCSNGGRQALMMARRYPEDWDGIIAGASVGDHRAMMLPAIWIAQMQRGSDAALTPSLIEIIGRRVGDQCDALDGLADGILANPRACAFDPFQLRCANGAPGNGCLSDAQVETVRRIYDGPRDRNGVRIAPGLTPGGEAGPGGWRRWLVGDGRAPLAPTFAEEMLRYFAFDRQDPSRRIEDFDFATSISGGMLDRMAIGEPDFRQFVGGGGKIILWQGWSDPVTPPESVIAFYQRASGYLGSDTDRALALFMAPGVQHCYGGPGADRFDLLSALDAWVEHSEEPNAIIASHYEDIDAAPTFQRPLCRFPETAFYRGTGDVSLAESFQCLAP